MLYDRFHLQTLCSDITASVTIIFPDSEVSRISEKTVEDLYSPEKEVKPYISFLYSCTIGTKS